LSHHLKLPHLWERWFCIFCHGSLHSQVESHHLVGQVTHKWAVPHATSHQLGRQNVLPLIGWQLLVEHRHKPVQQAGAELLSLALEEAGIGVLGKEEAEVRVAVECLAGGTAVWGLDGDRLCRWEGPLAKQARRRR
jgi:hypothetical protein